METQGEFRAVDTVPMWSASMGMVSILSTVALILLGGDGGSSGLLLMGVLLLATLGLTLGTCGVLLAIRDRRHLALALFGTVGSLSLPLYMLAGMPWN